MTQYFLAEKDRDIVKKVIDQVTRTGNSKKPQRRRRGKIGASFGGLGSIAIGNVIDPVNSGTADTPSSGKAIVYEVNSDGTTTEIGEFDVWNPFNHRVKGSVSLSKLDQANYLIIGFDLLEALYLIENAGARTVLHIPEDAAGPVDIKWQDTIRCAEISTT